jgi:hypothetical protein
MVFKSPELSLSLACLSFKEFKFMLMKWNALKGGFKRGGT